jgi:DNA-binding transcriptional LysR family regulator
MDVGFIGPPIPFKAPELFAVYADRFPDYEVSHRELAFPSVDSGSWLRGVDVAVCHPPPSEDSIGIQPFALEPRMLVVPADHRLARREEVAVEEVLEETFLSYHADVLPAWAAFHSLDDHRGAPPERVTRESARTALEMLALIASHHGVTTLPECEATLIARAFPDAVAIPIRDATPFTLALAWRADSRCAGVEALVTVARELAEHRSLVAA